MFMKMLIIIFFVILKLQVIYICLLDQAKGDSFYSIIQLISLDMKNDKILVTGPFGRIGSQLLPELQTIYGKQNVIALAHKKIPPNYDGPIQQASITDKQSLQAILKRNNINIIYHLAAILSATGQTQPDLVWNINLQALKTIFDLAVQQKIKVFWASSMAIFGPTTPKLQTPQKTIIQPITMYGVTKYSGQLLGQYYNKKYQVDIRSLRYPGLLSWVERCGGGTTDYAVNIFYEGIVTGKYQCFVSQETRLAMMAMKDAIRATIQLMQAPQENITIRTSYNIGSLSFSAKQLENQLKKYIPTLQVTYKPDHRQQIADSWVTSIDDSQARKDWGWQPTTNFSQLIQEMYENIRNKLNK